jgi:hypothetical protein
MEKYRVRSGRGDKGRGRGARGESGMRDAMERSGLQISRLAVRLADQDVCPSGASHKGIALCTPAPLPLVLALDFQVIYHPRPLLR